MNVGIIGHGKQEIEKVARSTSLTDLGVIDPGEERIELSLSKYEEMVNEIQRLRKENEAMECKLKTVMLLEGIDVDPNTIEVYTDFDIETCRKTYMIKFKVDRFSDMDGRFGV